VSVKEAQNAVGIKYSMRDLICDVINHCTSRFALSKLSVSLRD